MIPRAYCSLLQPQVARKYFGFITYLVKGSRAFSRCSPWRVGGEATLCQPSALNAPPRVISIATLLYEPQTNYSREAQGGPVVVTINGWIKSHRSMKKYSFLHLTDGTTIKPLQAVIPKEKFEDAKVWVCITLCWYCTLVIDILISTPFSIGVLRSWDKASVPWSWLGADHTFS